MIIHDYQRGDYHFYIWWEFVYKKELDNFKLWTNGETIPAYGSDDAIRRDILQAYYHGLCDARKKLNDGP
jgi:hypothetical protein